MSSKGPSNCYGDTRGSNQNVRKRTINYPWAKAFNKNALDKHFQDHGKQMGCATKESYEAHAVKFANTIDRKHCVSFVDRKGSTYKYNKKTNEFAVITKDGVVITYFKPKEGYNYYLKEKKNKKVK